MEYPRNTVWYIEARPFIESPGFAPVVASMGSAVVVQLETCQSNGAPHDPPQIRKYLLTCGHVVRESTTDGKNQKGWGPKLLEIFCFRPGQGYWRTLPNNRRSGDHRGAWRAMPKFSPHAHVDGNVPELERLPQHDWVVLDVEDSKFQFVNAAKLSGFQDELRFGIIGFPGGAVPPGGAAWGDNHFVEAAGPVAYTGERQGEPGLLTLTGDATKPGMSGGGVFTETENILAGLHRGSLDAAAAGFAIDLKYILAELWYKWHVRPVVEVQHGPSPAERDACQDLEKHASQKTNRNGEPRTNSKLHRLLALIVVLILTVLPFMLLKGSCRPMDDGKGEPLPLLDFRQDIVQKVAENLAADGTVNDVGQAFSHTRRKFYLTLAEDMTRPGVISEPMPVIIGGHKYTVTASISGEIRSHFKNDRLTLEGKVIILRPYSRYAVLIEVRDARESQ